MKAIIVDYLLRRTTETSKEEVLKLAGELRLKISPAEASKIAGRTTGAVEKLKKIKGVLNGF